MRSRMCGNTVPRLSPTQVFCRFPKSASKSYMPPSPSRKWEDYGSKAKECAGNVQIVGLILDYADGEQRARNENVIWNGKKEGGI